MAIKISNTTVISDSRNLENANSATFTGTGHIKLPAGGTADRPDSATNGMIRYNTDEETFEGYVDGEWGPIGGAFDIILTPTNVSPANNATGILARPTLEASTYYHAYGKPKANGQWQISTSNTFGTFVVNDTVSGTANTYTITTDLTVDTTYYWRVRYQDGDGVFSAFSTPTQFATAASFGPTLGQSLDGGYYIGDIDIGGGVCYYLIVAPNATGCACCQWKTTRTLTSGTGSCVNGYTNTYGPMDNATHPAGNWTATRSISGYSDWYLPARDELNLMYTNKDSMPSGEGFAADVYWSSTENNACTACRQYFSNGFIGNYVKPASFSVRAVRRSPI
jgi:hypothetical protein